MTISFDVGRHNIISSKVVVERNSLHLYFYTEDDVEIKKSIIKKINKEIKKLSKYYYLIHSLLRSFIFFISTVSFFYMLYLLSEIE